MIKRLNPDLHYSDHFLAGRIKNCCQTCEQAKEGGTKKVSIHLKVFVFKKKKHFGGRGRVWRPDIGKHEYVALWYQIILTDTA
jgi:hypothetical protein